MNAVKLIDELEQIIECSDRSGRKYAVYIPSKNEPMSFNDVKKMREELNTDKDFPYNDWDIPDIELIIRVTWESYYDVNFYRTYVKNKRFWGWYGYALHSYNIDDVSIDTSQNGDKFVMFIHEIHS